MSNETLTRQPRTLVTREKQQRTGWAPPSILPEPAPQDGYVFRWVRVSTGGQVDANNLSSRLREGFELVRAEDHPELKLHEVRDTNSKFHGCIESGGLVLCKMPVEFVQQRSNYYNGQTQQQMESVDASLMRENDPRMPLFKERKSKVTFGNGN